MGEFVFLVFVEGVVVGCGGGVYLVEVGFLVGFYYDGVVLIWEKVSSCLVKEEVRYVLMFSKREVVV